jgi:hypothetical protein
MTQLALPLTFDDQEYVVRFMRELMLAAMLLRLWWAAYHVAYYRMNHARRLAQRKASRDGAPKEWRLWL